MKSKKVCIKHKSWPWGSMSLLSRKIRTGLTVFTARFAVSHCDSCLFRFSVYDEHMELMFCLLMFDTCAISFARRTSLMRESSCWMLMLVYDLHLIWIPFLSLNCASLCCFGCWYFFSFQHSQILTTCWSLIIAYRSTNSNTLSTISFLFIPFKLRWDLSFCSHIFSQMKMFGH